MADQPTAIERFINGILPENPVFRQIIGMCPTLAITNGMKPAFTMACSVLFVLLGANIVTSLIRNLLKPHLRMVVFTLTIAAFVTIADRFLAAYFPQMSKTLGPFIPLIIVNCIIICRCEVCAAKQSVFISAADAIGQSIGYGIALLSIAAIREILGTGDLFGIAILPASWPDWVIMILPPGAFITLGLMLGTVNWVDMKRTKK
jgi:Na+-translocating ferredoxin:NAD+ oxidoreductase subunit E